MFWAVDSEIEGRPWKGKDPPVFSGRPLEFSEWQFAIEEAHAVVRPADQVRFAVSYLSGDARRWFMTAYPDGERPKDWTSLRNGVRAAFSPDGERAFHRTRLFRIRQVGPPENYIAEFRSLCISSSGVDDKSNPVYGRVYGGVTSGGETSSGGNASNCREGGTCRAAECEPELIEQDDLPSSTPSSSLYASESDVGKNEFSRRPTSIAPERGRQNTIRCFDCGLQGWRSCR